MNTNETISAGLTRDISRLCQQFGLHTMYLFDSRFVEITTRLSAPTGKPQKLSSDIDIGVRIMPGRWMDVRDKVRLTQELEMLFDDQRVDLVMLDEADPFMAANIVRGLRLFTVDDYAADEYELYILRCAADLAHFERNRQALILGTA